MTEGTLPADIAGATFGGIAASAVLLKAAHWIYMWWKSRPTHLARLLNRIATNSASKEEENEAERELRRLEMETRHQMLSGVMTRYTEAGDVEAILALSRFRTVMDGRVGEGRRVDETGRMDTTASQTGHTSHQNVNNNRGNNHRNTGYVSIEELFIYTNVRPRRKV